MAKKSELKIHNTIQPSDSLVDYWIAVVVHLAIWGGGMVLGPLLLLAAPFWFLFLPFWSGLALAVFVSFLTVLSVPESPLVNRLFLRTATLLKGGSTIWMVDEVVEHIGDGMMVCYHPHGIIPLGFTLNGAIRAKTRQPKKYLPPEAMIDHKVSGVQAPILFRIPILRQVLLSFGCTMPATKDGMFKLFRKKMPFGIIVGGSEDVAIQITGRERIYLRHRAGFLKYALQFGYKVVVAYNFGESDLYRSFSILAALNLWLVKRFGFVLPLFYGQWWCPLLPRSDVTLNTVYGAVLELPRIDFPSDEEVAHWHGKYIEAVTDVFETHKERFGFASRTLEIL